MQPSTGAYIAKLGAFAGTLEALLDCMTQLKHRPIGATERAVLLITLESAKSGAATIALFKHLNQHLGTLTPEQTETLQEFMKTVETLEEDIQKSVVELEVIRSGW